MICEKCGKEHDGEYGSGRFCSAKCARAFASKHVTDEGRKKQKEILTDKKNLEKSFNTRMENNENYELDSDGRWNRVSKAKKNKSKKDKHTLVTGKIGELEVAKKFAKHGYSVFAPLVDIHGTDLIVEKDDGLKKVQVKTSSQSADSDGRSTEFGLYTNSLQVKKGKVTNHKKLYDKKDVDYFALYSEIDNDVYLVENDGKHGSITIRNSISPTSLTTKDKNLEKIHMAKDYQIDKVLDEIDNKINQSNIIEIDDFVDTSEEE